MKDGFVLRLDENAVLADQFTAAGYDQYGREMTGSFEWVTSKPDVVSLENGTLKALKEDSTEIYARSGDIESNHITLTVTAPRRLTAITADASPRPSGKMPRSTCLRSRSRRSTSSARPLLRKSWRPTRLRYAGRWKRMIPTRDQRKYPQLR